MSGVISAAISGGATVPLLLKHVVRIVPALGFGSDIASAVVNSDVKEIIPSAAGYITEKSSEMIQKRRLIKRAFNHSLPGKIVNTFVSGINLIMESFSTE